MADPRLTMRRFADRAALVRGAAEALASAIADAIAERGRCRLALAGGSTPRPVYERLSLVTGIDWGAVHVFWGDERCVSADDEASNYRMAREALLDHVEIPTAQVHRIEGARGGRDAAAAYSAVLGPESLDLVLLGMGDDGHTASLFPGGAEVESTARVAPARAPVAPHDRVTLTLPTINAARAVWFWVVGEGKAARLAEVFTQVAIGEPVLPAARVAPSSGEVVWFVDEAAAREV